VCLKGEGEAACPDSQPQQLLFALVSLLLLTLMLQPAHLSGG